MKTKYRKLRGSNQWTDIIRVEHDTLTLKGWVTVTVFSLVTMYLVSSYLAFVAANIRRVATRDIATLTTMTVEAFQFHTEDSGFYSPITRAYAYELMHQQPPLPEKTAKEIIYSKPHGDIIWRIYGLESSFGKEPFLYCTKQGKYSDMGYNVLNHQCFNSFAEEVSTVETWIEAHEGLPLGKMLCIYNTGTGKQCEYAGNFLGL